MNVARFKDEDQRLAGHRSVIEAWPPLRLQTDSGVGVGRWGKVPVIADWPMVREFPQIQFKWRRGGWKSWGDSEWFRFANAIHSWTLFRGLNGSVVFSFSFEVDTRQFIYLYSDCGGVFEWLWAYFAPKGCLVKQEIDNSDDKHDRGSKFVILEKVAERRRVGG